MASRQREAGHRPSPPLGGGCLCGAVRFALVPPLGATTHCHCRSCRRAHGAAFVTWTSVPTGRFRFEKGQSEVAWFRSSPQVRWGFCRRCGASMLYVADEAGHPEAPLLDHVYVALGSLDDGAPAHPSAHVSFEEHVGWLEGAHALPHYRAKTSDRLEVEGKPR